MTIAYRKINEQLGLMVQEIAAPSAVKVPTKTNHICVIDVSGSMYYELPKIKMQLKNKLPILLREGDTISIVWFSGKIQAGILQEGVEPSTPVALQQLNEAIDRWLEPMGLTAFAKPLELAKEIITRLKSSSPTSAFNLIFMSDGYNNDCAWKEVLGTLEELKPVVNASSFIEYGYYADSKAISQMATILGGEKISCSNFDYYEATFSDKVGKGTIAAPKVKGYITTQPLFNWAFTVNKEGEVVQHILEKEDNRQQWNVEVAPDITHVYYFINDKDCKNKLAEIIDNQALYAAAYLLADNLQYDLAEEVIKSLGDTFYYNKLSSAYGKQKLNALKASLKSAVVDPTLRYASSNPISERAAQNYSLIDLIEFLQSRNAFIYPQLMDIKSIGIKRIAKGKLLNDQHSEDLKLLNSIEEIETFIQTIKPQYESAEFVENDPLASYPMSDLVWNEERANLSIRVRKEGKIQLPPGFNLMSADGKWVIMQLNSFIYRTYNLIKDGIVNPTWLWVTTSPELEELLLEQKILFKYHETILTAIGIYIADLPVVTKKSVAAISAVELAKLEWELLEAQANRKVFDYYYKTLFPKTSLGFVEQFGAEQTEKLKELGITDYGGFAPKTEAAESTDVYMSVNLATKIKGFSSLPKVEDVVKKLESGGKLKPSESLMVDAVNGYLAVFESDLYKTLSDEKQLEMLKAYLDSKVSNLTKLKNEIMAAIAQIKFSMILSRKWFIEFSSFEENTLDLEINGTVQTFKFELSEKEVNI